MFSACRLVAIACMHRRSCCVGSACPVSTDGAPWRWSPRQACIAHRQPTHCRFPYLSLPPDTSYDAPPWYCHTGKQPRYEATDVATAVELFPLGLATHSRWSARFCLIFVHQAGPCCLVLGTSSPHAGHRRQLFADCAQDGPVGNRPPRAPLQLLYVPFTLTFLHPCGSLVGRLEGSRLNTHRERPMLSW